MRIAAKINGTFDYFGYDALGSQVVALNTSGALIGSQLYGPYGNSRYSAGTLPTSIGFTGQQTDSVTGLDYFNARYYDPVTGQFLSADVVQGNAQGMSPYMYVAGNPESRTDPTGKYFTDGTGYDRAWIEPDANGDGGVTLNVYTPENPADHSSRPWDNQTHYSKPDKSDPNGTYKADNVNGHPTDGHKQVCVMFCGAIKDPGLHANGVVQIVAGLAELLGAMVFLFAKAIMLGLTFLSIAASTILLGLREIATSHVQVNPTFLLILDSAKLVADSSTVVIGVLSAVEGGGGQKLLSSLKAFGQKLLSILTGASANPVVLVPSAQNLASTVLGIANTQGGTFWTVATDMVNIRTDAAKISAGDDGYSPCEYGFGNCQ